MAQKPVISQEADQKVQAALVKLAEKVASLDAGSKDLSLSEEERNHYKLANGAAKWAYQSLMKNYDEYREGESSAQGVVTSVNNTMEIVRKNDELKDHRKDIGKVLFSLYSAAHSILAVVTFGLAYGARLATNTYFPTFFRCVHSDSYNKVEDLADVILDTLPKPE